MSEGGPPDNPTVGRPPGGASGPAEPAHGTVLAGASIAYEPGAVDRAATAVGGGGALPPPKRRAYLQQVVYDTFQNLRARFASGWIVLLMFLACFAPFLASSHPLLVKVDGKWSSPFVQHLGPADVVLPCVFVTGVVLLARRRLGMGQGVLLLIWVAAVTSVFAAGPDFYTALEAAGEGRGPVAGAWRLLARSPVLTALWYLTWVGMVAFAIVAALRWLPRRTAGVTAAILTPLCALLIVFPLRPPENVVYEQYRVLQAQGKTEFMLRTIVPYSPTDRLRDDPDARLTGPSAAHWAGTDAYGADLLSRMIHGCRIALAIGFIATGIEVLIGVFVGGLMGYFAGTIDLIGMRLIEIIEAIPRLVLLIAVTAAYGRNLYMMMAIIGLLGWTGDARFVRAEFLKLRKQDFVQAAVASGLPLRSILFRHMLPNGVTPVLVSASFGVASAILLESTLSFLGLGLVDEPSWGAMLEQARSGGAGFNWWIATFPGLLIFLTVFAYNLIGESVRDALDPKLLKRE